MNLCKESVGTAGWVVLIVAATLLSVVPWEPGPLVWAIAAIMLGVALWYHWRRWCRGRFSSPRVEKAYLIWMVIESGWVLLVLCIALEQVFGH